MSVLLLLQITFHVYFICIICTLSAYFTVSRIPTNLQIFKYHRSIYIIIQYFERSNGIWPVQNCLWKQNWFRNILYTTPIGIFKPHGSNIAATIQEIILLLTREFLDSRNFLIQVHLKIRNWYDDGFHSRPSVLTHTLLSSYVGTSISLQSGGTVFNMLDDLHKTCTAEILLVLRAR